MVDGGSVMEQAIEQSRREDGIREDVAPLTVALVAGQDDRLPEIMVTFPRFRGHPNKPDSGRVEVSNGKREEAASPSSKRKPFGS